MSDISKRKLGIWGLIGSTSLISYYGCKYMQTNNPKQFREGLWQRVVQRTIYPSMLAAMVSHLFYLLTDNALDRITTLYTLVSSGPQTGICFRISLKKTRNKTTVTSHSRSRRSVDWPSQHQLESLQASAKMEWAWMHYSNLQAWTRMD